MMNQQKTPLRAPLLAALDKEYAEASRRKDLDRMAEIVSIVESLQGTAAAVPPPLTVAEAPELVAPAEARSILEPPTEPLPLPAAPAGAVGVTLQQLLRSAGPAIETENHAERRAAAKGRLKDAVLRVSALDDQIRYELAMQAHNRNIAVMTMFQAEAVSRGLTVAALAEQIIAERRVHERRVMHAHAVLARVSAEIDQATGDTIDAIVDAGMAEIEGMT